MKPLNTPLADSANTNANTYDDDAIVNPSANTHFSEVLDARLSRRAAIKGGLSATTAALFAGAALSGCMSDDPPAPAPAPAPVPPAPPAPLKLGFAGVAKNLNDTVTVPEGYQVSILHALGDPLHWGDESWKDDGSETADSYNRRIGDGHDGMHYFGLSDAGAFAPERSDRGLLCVNHEYVVGPSVLHPTGITAGAARVASEAEKEIYAHGVSVCEVKRESNGAVSMVRGSRFGRRVTSATVMDITGPARGSALMATKFSPTGVQARGTNNNCAHGYTPWGTYLTCEENFLNVISRVAGDNAKRSAKEVAGMNRYGLPEGRRSPYAWDTAGTDDLFARWSSSVVGASAADDYRHTINTFGWVIEIDPFNPTSAPVKRTALGRFNHEGAWPGPVVAGKPIVMYQGDDARNEYIYKFVSKANWDPADAGKGLAAGAKYLDEGTLYVAKFNANGSGEWVELTHGKNGLDATNTAYPFADQADVVIHARLAADKVGATKMDRPEWGAVNPLNGEVYMTLTNNSNRVAPSATPTGNQLKPDAANPRYYEDLKGTATQRGNPNGHIIRWAEEGGNGAATKFTWDIYLFGAQADAAADVNLSSLTAVNDFSSPDGLYFDKRGMLWIQTDDGAYTDVTNCMMLAAIPGKVGDGAVATAAGGTSTRRGAAATADTVRRFLVGPKDCEVTGIVFTPDHKTMFVNIQHPGEDTKPDFAARTYGSYWPANQANPSAKGRPRSATVVITRRDGGEVGI